jgi:hypothetical protein
MVMVSLPIYVNVPHFGWLDVLCLFLFFNFLVLCICCGYILFSSIVFICCNSYCLLSFDVEYVFY